MLTSDPAKNGREETVFLIRDGVGFSTGWLEHERREIAPSVVVRLSPRPKGPVRYKGLRT